MKLGASVFAVMASLLARGPTLMPIVIAAVVLVVIVIATYILIARRGVAPRLHWGNLKIEFARLPEPEDPAPPRG